MMTMHANHRDGAQLCFATGEIMDEHINVDQPAVPLWENEK